MTSHIEQAHNKRDPNLRDGEGLTGTISITNLTHGGQDVLRAYHLVVDGQIVLAVVVAGREDVRVHDNFEFKIEFEFELKYSLLALAL